MFLKQNLSRTGDGREAGLEPRPPAPFLTVCRYLNFMFPEPPISAIISIVPLNAGSSHLQRKEPRVHSGDPRRAGSVTVDSLGNPRAAAHLPRAPAPAPAPRTCPRPGAAERGLPCGHGLVHGPLTCGKHHCESRRRPGSRRLPLLRAQRARRSRPALGAPSPLPAPRPSPPAGPSPAMAGGRRGGGGRRKRPPRRHREHLSQAAAAGLPLPFQNGAQRSAPRAMTSSPSATSAAGAGAGPPGSLLRREGRGEGPGRGGGTARTRRLSLRKPRCAPPPRGGRLRGRQASEDRWLWVSRGLALP